MKNSEIAIEAKRVCSKIMDKYGFTQKEKTNLWRKTGKLVIKEIDDDKTIPQYLRKKGMEPIEAVKLVNLLEGLACFELRNTI